MYSFNPVFNKKPSGPSKKNCAVEYVLGISKDINPTAVFFCYKNDFNEDIVRNQMAIQHDGDSDITFRVSVTFEKEGLYWYHFEVYQGEHMFYLQCTPSLNVEPTGELTSCFQQLVYSTTSKTTKRFKGGVMYHIFVDRFYKQGEVIPRDDLILRRDWGGAITKNSDRFNVINKECFGGNLKGVISKLDYLKSLNVSTIYLSPIFEANSYHKYDTADYSKIDSMLGTQEDLEDLIKKAKANGIEIILDGVFNHTGDDSIYFNKYEHYNSLGAYQSKRSPYYKWYSFQSYPDKYSSWWGIDTLPQVKGNSKSFTNYIAGKGGIIEKYMKLGLLGFRLDVVDEIDNDRLNKICKAIKSVRKDGIVIGEVWEDASNKIAYDRRRNYFLGGQLDSVMNYPVKDAIINYITTQDSSNLNNVLYMIKDHYPKDIQDNLMNILGTHDTSRIMTIIKNNCDDKDRAIKLFKIATLIQFTIMGVPCIFYGDECGLEGEGTPYCRVCFPWNKKNNTLKLWYEFLGKLRSDPVFASGDINILCANSAVFGFERVVGKSKVIVYTNTSNIKQKVAVEKGLYDCVSNKKVAQQVVVPANGYLILKK